MEVSRFLLVCGIGFLIAEGKPVDSPTKTLSLPLQRHWQPPVSFDDKQQSQPLTSNGLASLVYTVQVLVGTPPQHFNLTLDTNEHAAVLFTKGFTSTNHSCSRGDGKRNLFDASQSKTYLQTPPVGDPSDWALYRFPYVGVECHHGIGWAETDYGVEAQDTFSLLSFAVKNVSFILANHTYWPLNPRWHSDGVFPLGTLKGEAMWDILSGLGDKREVSLWLNPAPLRGSTAGAQSPGGAITFGGKDSVNCGSEWTKIAGGYAAWNIWVSSVQVGVKVVFNSGSTAELSVASPFLEVPDAYYRQIVNAFHAEYNFELDLYTVDCSQNPDSLPGIRISLGVELSNTQPQLTYTVPAKDFIAELSTSSGTKCALLIVQDDRGVGGLRSWVVGSQFLPKRCVHLDYANEWISFADPLSK